MAPAKASFRYRRPWCMMAPVPASRVASRSVGSNGALGPSGRVAVAEDLGEQEGDAVVLDTPKPSLTQRHKLLHLHLCPASCSTRNASNCQPRCRARQRRHESVSAGAFTRIWLGPSWTHCKRQPAISEKLPRLAATRCSATPVCLSLHVSSATKNRR